MPVAGEDAVLDGAAIKREAHVRAAIVDREDSASGVEQGDDVAVNGHGLAASFGDFRERRGAHETAGDIYWSILGLAHRRTPFACGRSALRSCL
ncbi:MAG TPA: hypothetical protein VIX59_17760 [Candidatus Binataceae bacterium]